MGQSPIALNAPTGVSDQVFLKKGWKLGKNDLKQHPVQQKQLIALERLDQNTVKGLSHENVD